MNLEAVIIRSTTKRKGVNEGKYYPIFRWVLRYRDAPGKVVARSPVTLTDENVCREQLAAFLVDIQTEAEALRWKRAPVHDRTKGRFHAKKKSV